MITQTDIFSQQDANRRRTTWLVAGFIVFLTWLGFGGDYIWYLATRGSNTVHVVPGIGIVFAIIALLMTRWAFSSGPLRLIATTGAREITESSRDYTEQQLRNIVEEMAIAAGTPMPHVWIVPDPAPNAFATGMAVDNAHIAVTEGLLATCTREEIQGVVAHEMGHVVNLDVRLMTVLTALVGVIVLIREGGLRMVRPGRGARWSSSGSSDSGGGSSGSSSKSSSNNDRDRGGGGAGALVLILLALWILSWILAPLILRTVAAMIGRTREYLADAMSAQFTRNPGALISALEKISTSPVKTEKIPRGTAHLCIADPYHSRWDEREGFFADLFGTHPPLVQRIARLRAMVYNNAIRVNYRP